MITERGHPASALVLSATATLRNVTVAVMVKVFDGVVLAADSATTVPLPGPDGRVSSHQVYNSANKVFHLHRDLPIGAATWGLGSIGNGSIGSLAKDFRKRLMGKDLEFSSWNLDPASYTVEEVVTRMVEMFFDELYAPLRTGMSDQTLGFVIAGYGSASPDAEVWVLELSQTLVRPVPVKVAGGDQAGWVAFAQSDAMNRLFRGYDDALQAELCEKFGAAEVQPILNRSARTAVIPPMPFMDAINLAGYMVDVTSGYSRYLLGPDTVGGPVEIAGISRHEGFKWVARKHYFNSALNPEPTYSSA